MTRDFTTDDAKLTKRIGNYRGRKPGSRNKRLALLRSAEPQLLRKLVKMARGGDMAAMKIIADRLWPRLRSETAPIRIQEPAGDLSQFGQQIVALIGAGRLAPDVGASVLQALGAQAELVEHLDFEKRLLALESLEADRSRLDQGYNGVAGVAVPRRTEPEPQLLRRREKRRPT